MNRLSDLPAGVNVRELDGAPEFDLFEELEAAAVALGAKEPNAIDAWNAALVDLRDTVETLKRENLQLRHVLAEQRQQASLN